MQKFSLKISGSTKKVKVGSYDFEIKIHYLWYSKKLYENVDK